MAAIRTLQLLGLKHTGKSSLGRLWASRRGWEFYDLDTLLEARAGGARTSRQIFLEEGREGFQHWEAEAASFIAGRLLRGRAVLAWGGGTVTNPKAVATLKDIGTLVILSESCEILFERIMKGGRPAFLSASDPWKDFQALYIERGKLLEALSPWSLNLAGVGLDGAVEKMEQLWNTIPDVGES